MDISLTGKGLSKIEKIEIKKLLDGQNPAISDDLEQMWYLLDFIWDQCECKYKRYNWDNIGKYYSHSVWLLNGLFIEQDETSMGHRYAISNWVIEKNLKTVLDYGGGFGTLSRLIAKNDQAVNVDIYEPHPSEFGLKRVARFNNLRFVRKLDISYDCLLSTDVLEHVPDPLATLHEMITSVNQDGFLVIANCFQPVIKCHLPENYHFQHTFNIFAITMGLKVIGNLRGSHATIYQKVRTKEPNWALIRLLQKLSIIMFPLIGFLKPAVRPLKRFIAK